MRRFLLVTAFLVAACARFTLHGGAGQPAVSGITADWKTGQAVAGVSVRSVGILPELNTVSGEDGRFVLEGLPVNGFVLLELSRTGYETTLSPPILVEESDVTDVRAPIVAAAHAGAILSGYGIVMTSGRGVVAGRLLRTDGTGMPGVSSVALSIAQFDGPHFLDASGDPPAADILATSSSGAYVFANTAAGGVTVTASAAGLQFFDLPTIAIAGVWTIADLHDTTGNPAPVGTPPSPTPVSTPGPQSFELDIDPIFQFRGCDVDGCHAGAAAAGGLRLRGTTSSIYSNVFPRINPFDPPASLLLAKPLFEQTPNHGGGNIFLSTADPDYQKILRWITDGAPNN